MVTQNVIIWSGREKEGKKKTEGREVGWLFDLIPNGQLGNAEEEVRITIAVSRG